MSNFDAVEISLIIDDNNTKNFKLETNQINPESISNLCNQISETYSLNERAKERLFNYITKEIEAAKNYKENNKNTINNSDRINNSSKNISHVNKSSELIFDRLYYQGTKAKKEREIISEKIQRAKEEEEMKNYSFAPKINSNTSLFLNRDKRPIGDKLYSQGRKHHGFGRSQIEEKILKISHNYPNEDITNSQKDTSQNCNKFVIGIDEILGDENKKISFDKNDELILSSDERTKKATKTKTAKKKSIHISNYTKEMKQVQNLKRNNKIEDFKRQNPKLARSSDTGEMKENLKKYSKSQKKIASNTSTNFTGEKWFDRLYNSKQIYDTKKKEMQEDYYNQLYPFNPKLSNGSITMMKKRNESPAELYNRLSSSKTVASVKNSISVCKSTERPRGRSLGAKRQQTESRSETARYLERKGIKEEKSDENLRKKIEKYENDKKIPTKFFQENSNINIERFKLNQIKEIFEILIRDKEKINFDALAENGIPAHIIDKVVKPACYMINDKGLEFNFQNFYLISNELLNSFFV